jgi:hypothetical protein
MIVPYIVKTKIIAVMDVVSVRMSPASRGEYEGNSVNSEIKPRDADDIKSDLALD